MGLRRRWLFGDQLGPDFRRWNHDPGNRAPAPKGPGGIGVVELAGPAMQAPGGRFLARGRPAHVFEGGLADRTMLIEFDSVAAAVAAYQSQAYQRALVVLGDAADRDLRIIEAVT